MQELASSTVSEQDKFLDNLLSISFEESVIPTNVGYGFTDYILSDPREDIGYFDGKVIGRGNVYVMKQSTDYSETAKEKLNHETIRIFKKD